MKVIFNLLSPLTHGGFTGSDRSQGNHTPIRRLPLFVQGEVLEVPALSGNSLRGVLRRKVMRNFLDVLWPDERPDGFDLIYATLANGGILDGHDATLNPAFINSLRERVPPLSLFGAAMRKWMLEGRLHVGICWPACKATEALTGITSNADLSDIESDFECARLPDKNVQDSTKTGLKPMPYSFETIIAGTTLVSEIIFTPEATLIERSLLCSALKDLNFIGANNATGMGKCDVVIQEGAIDEKHYLDWIASPEHQDQARTALQEALA